MKKEYIEGFVKRAQELGIDKDTALGLVNKTANHPGGGLDGGMQAGGAAPDPAAIAGAAGAGGEAGGQGIPPEIEQLIDQLPPEVLAQLVQEIEQQLGGGAGGAGAPPAPHQGGGMPPQHGGGMPPQHGGGHPGGHPGGAGGMPPGGGMPMPPKQAGQRLYVKEAAYINGFLSHAYDLGFNKEEAKSIYKQALALCEAEAQPRTKVASAQKEQRNPHYDGFMKSASAYGLAPQQAYQLYVETFVNN